MSVFAKKASFVVPAQVSGAAAGAQPRTYPTVGSSVRRQAFMPPTNMQHVARILQQMQTNNIQSSGPANSNPVNASAILQGIAATSGTNFLLYHRLGRVPVGWVTIDSQTASWAGYRVAPAVGAKGPSGGPQEADYLTIHPTATGTYAFLVF